MSQVPNFNSHSFSKIKRVAFNLCYNLVVIALFYSAVIHPLQAYATTKRLVDLKEIQAIYPYLKSRITDTTAEEKSNSVVNTQKSVAAALSTFGNARGKVNSAYIYEADLPAGIIGATFDIADDPFDNLFKIKLDMLPTFDDRVYLEYEVKGVADLASVSRSINENVAIGGSLIKTSNSWSFQSEQINPQLLYQGENKVLFTVFEELGNAIEIKNVRIKIEKALENSTNASDFRITNSYVLKDDEIYLRGFVNIENRNSSIFKLDGTSIELSDSGEFETILRADSPQLSRIEMVQTQSGIDLKELISIDRKDLNFDKVFKLESRNSVFGFVVESQKDQFLEADGATLFLPKAALQKDAVIAIEKLRKNDLAPTGMTITNVTKGQLGYRFTPDKSHFEKDLKLSITYDAQLLPSGYSERDIHIFYFDTQSKAWKPVQTDSIDVKNQIIISKTNHFTDYVAGVIQVPESPESNSFTPTTVGDIPAAHPTDKINFIEMPSANQEGDAVLSYPIEIPGGRKGMQPNLTVQYNSSGGNGWMGLGWNINVGTIDINTKWGAIKYDATKETESYLVNGEEVTLRVSDNSFYLPYRNTEINRISNAMFYPRQEGSFNRIQRLGSSPKNYSWVVTDKGGIKYYYGQTSDSQLQTDSGNIARWFLEKVEDLNGNFIKYHYSKKTFTSGTLAGGKQVYLASITYTLHNTDNTASYYRVSFNRTNSPQGIGTRLDKSINARLGIKEIVDDVLDEITVSLVDEYSESTIRSYSFLYKKGAFGKTLLDQIQQKDFEGNVFNTHTFEYYNDTGSGLFSPAKQITAYSDFDNLFTKLKTSPSALGGSASESKEYSGAITAGVASIAIPSSLNPLSKNSTLGVNQSKNTSKSESIIALVDMDGDGLPDKLIRKHNRLYYRKNNGNSFSEYIIPIEGQNSFSKSKTMSKSTGFEAHFFGFINAGKTWTEIETNIFLEDVNADGLIDIVKNKEVFFNSINPTTALPKFTKNSSLTPNAVDVGSQVLGVTTPKTVNTSTVDIVKIWIAPKSGYADINGMIYPNSGGKKMRFSIEKATATELGAATFIQEITLFSTNTATNFENIFLEKGDRLFFRVIANTEDYKNNRAIWNPSIVYKEDSNYQDPNGYNPYKTSFPQGFLVGGSMPQTIRSNGHFSVYWPGFTIDNSTDIPELSDEVTLVLKRYKLNSNGQPIAADFGMATEIYRQRISLNKLNFLTDYSYEFGISNIVEDDVTSFQYIKAEIWADSNVNWKHIDEKWRPILQSLDQSQANESLLKEMSVFHEGIKTQSYFEITRDTRFFSKHYFQLPACNVTQGLCPQNYIYLVVKNGNGKVLTEPGDPNQFMKFRYLASPTGLVTEAKKYNDISGLFDTNVTGDVLDFVQNFDMNDANQNKIYFEYYTDNLVLADKLKLVDSNWFYDESNSFTTVFYPNILYRGQNNQFGTMHQNWGQFAYRGKEIDRQMQPILLSDLTYESIQNAATENTQNPTQEEMTACDDKDTYEEYKECLDSFGARNGTELKSKMFLLIPNRGRQQWEVHNQLYVQIDKVQPNIEINDDDDTSSGGDDQGSNDPPGAGDGPSGGDGVGSVHNHIAVSIVKRISSKSKDISAGFYASGTSSETKTALKNDYRDINGDGYPDIITDKIQWTNSRGGLTSNVIDKMVLQKSNADGVGGGAAMGGGAGLNMTICSDGTGVNGNHSITRSGMGVGFGVSASFFSIKDYTESELIDINGDGLPDFLERNGNVALNFGYGFQPQSNWGLTDLKKTETQTFSGGGGISLFNGSISAGFSIAKNISEDKISVIDVNGDGLPDKIINGNQVYLNTGTGFEANAISLPVSSPRTSDSYSGGVNINATYCFYFIIPVISTGPKACVSVGGNIGMGINKETVQVMDFDGDGYPDILKSDSEGSLKVYFSKVGRTNMLKAVNRPLGAIITLDYNNHNPHTNQKIGTTYAMPFSKWVMTKATLYDGYKGDGEDYIRKSFEYYNGYKDRRERSFLGFGEVITNDLDYNNQKYRSQVVQYLQNDMTSDELYSPGKDSRLRQYYFKRGLVKKSFLRDKHGRIHQAKNYDYRFFNAVTASQNNLGFSYNMNGNSVSSYPENNRILPLLSNITTESYAYNGADDADGFEKSTRVDFDKYDLFGNVKNYRDNGESGGSNSPDLINVVINYHQNWDRYMVSSPREHQVITNNTNRRTETKIDDNGNVLNIWHFLNGNNEYAETIMEYDQYGNIIKKRNPLPFVDSSEDMAFTTEIRYDDNFYIYPVEISNAQGAVKKIVYSRLLGNIIQTTDPFDVKLYYEYDNFGRLLRVKDSNRGKIPTGYILRNTYFTDEGYGGNPLASVVTEKIKASPDSQDYNQSTSGALEYMHSSVFVDGIGRPIQVKKQLQRDENCTSNTGYRFAVSSLTLYDEFGRVVTDALPVEESSCIGSLQDQLKRMSYPSIDNENTTTYRYDYLDRVTHSTLSGIAAMTETKYGHGVDCNNKHQFSQEIILPEGNRTIIYTDARNRQTSSKQVGALNEDLCTTFSNGALGELLSVTDAEGAVTSYKYDNLGRKVYSAHPDKGQTWFEYDLLHQLIGLTTENLKDENQKITYQYDLQRLVRIKYSNHEVNFTYDLNRIIKQDDQTGSQEFKYGFYGELVENNRIIVDPLGRANHANAYKMKFGYDYWGRILTMEYPDEEKIHYKYDEGGNLEKVYSVGGRELIKNIRYNQLGSQTKIVYGNDVVTEYFYGLQQRLRTMTLRRPTNQLFLKNEYWYDRNSNITKFSNDTSLSSQLDIGGTSNKSFEYDSYNRLKNADIRWEGMREIHDFKLNMKYNKTHGITSKVQNHQVENIYTHEIRLTDNTFKSTYLYVDTEKPHAVSNIRMVEPNYTSLHNYEYDKNGNLTSSNERVGNNSVTRRLYWDDQDRLQAVVDGNEVNFYLYDASGERVIKSFGNAQNLMVNGGHVVGLSTVDDFTVYPSGYLVVGPNKYTKHYYFNNQKIASQTGDSSNFMARATRSTPPDEVLAARTANLQQQMKEVYEGANLDSPTFQARETLSDFECEQELYDIKKRLLDKKNYDCLNVIKDMESQGLTDCEVLKEYKKTPCYLETACEEEYHQWLDYLYFEGKTGCTTTLKTLVEEGKSYCDVLYYVKKTTSCLEIITITDCYLEFIELYESCTRANDYKCLKFLQELMTQEELDYCDIVEIIKESEFNVIYPPVIPPVDTFPPVEDPVVDPGNPDNETPPVIPNEPIIPEPPFIQGKIWWYHSDHLGSSSYLTDVNGMPTHYYEYLPFGELMVEHNNSNYDNVYKFNAKELDEKTGYYYYGARYYDPRTSLFLSVDPLAEQFPGWTPYHYVHNNPINLIDPTGMSAENSNGGGGFFSRMWSGVKNTFSSSSKAEDMTVLDEIVITVSGQNKEERIKDKKVNSLLSDWRFENTKNEWRAQGIWDDNLSYNNWGHAVGSQLGLVMPSARFNGLFSLFSKAEAGFTVNPSKFDYFFGRVTTGHADNIRRSADNLRDLTKLGINNQNELMKVFNKAFESGAILSTKTNHYGTTITRGVQIGGKGAINVGFFYEGGKMGVTPSVSTIIPKIY